MHWVTIIWTMTAAACLTLAGVHALIWSRQRIVRANLLFTLAAIGTAGMTVCECWMMRSQTPEEYGLALKWLHFPAWVVVVSLVWFVRDFLQAGRPWLGWTVCGVRTVSLLLDFLFAPNLNFSRINELHHVRFLGESISVAVGPHDPWMLVGQLSLVLMVVFVAEATFTVWRRGDRRQALLVGGSIILFTATGTGQAVLFLWGIVEAPMVVSLFFIGCLAAMSYELSEDVLRAARLSGELHDSQERMRLAAKAASLGLWEWDLVRDEMWVNDVSRGRANLQANERLDFNRFLQVVHADDRDHVKLAVRRSIEDGSEFEAEYRIRTSDGEWRWIAAWGQVEFNNNHHKPLRVRGVSLDVTDRKRVEEANRSLAHVQRLAMLGELTAMIAHEVNQPLGAILSNADAAEILMEAPDPPLDQIRTILAGIRKNDLRADEAIRRIRALLRKRQIQMEPVNVNEMVSEVVRLVAGDALRRQVRVRQQLAEDLAPALGDRVHLQQVLMNLILNGMDAMKDTQKSARELVVRTQPDGEGGIEVAVTDCGCGIPAERMPRLFDSFFTTKHEGMGLGLSIARSIVEAHKGRVWAQNNPEGGATFHFKVRAAKDAAGQDAGLSR
jgi:two-component system, LuxR family, sensor kinase FixL